MEPFVTIRNRSNQPACIIGFNPADVVRGVDCGQFILLPNESQKVTATIAGDHLNIGIVDDTYYQISDTNFSHHYFFRPGVRGNWVTYRLFELDAQDTGKSVDLIAGSDGCLCLSRTATKLENNLERNIKATPTTDAYSYRDMELNLFLKFLAIKMKREPKEKVVEYLSCLFMRNVLNFDNVKDTAVFFFCIFYLVSNSVTMEELVNAVLPGNLKFKLPEGFDQLPSRSQLNDTMTDSINKMPALISMMMHNPALKERLVRMYVPELTDVFVDAWNIFVGADSATRQQAGKADINAEKIIGKGIEALEIGKQKAGEAMNAVMGKGGEAKKDAKEGMNSAMNDNEGHAQKKKEDVKQNIGEAAGIVKEKAGEAWDEMKQKGKEAKDIASNNNSSGSGSSSNNQQQWLGMSSGQGGQSHGGQSSSMMGSGGSSSLGGSGLSSLGGQSSGQSTSMMGQSHSAGQSSMMGGSSGQSSMMGGSSGQSSMMGGSHSASGQSSTLGQSSMMGGSHSASGQSSTLGQSSGQSSMMGGSSSLGQSNIGGQSSLDKSKISDPLDKTKQQKTTETFDKENVHSTGNKY
jgi:hypothetical protein